MFIHSTIASITMNPAAREHRIVSENDPLDLAEASEETTRGLEHQARVAPPEEVVDEPF